ncbi:MAG TPA: 6-phosphogluconolactonase [Spirochaetia bacterium]|nr:6-phosphogluconolactonase [Spirochaetales bacterium]HPD80388.1 6-phosphogluconolactonase [Spirochaetales bacterium]HQK33181.1 6-phosphogluconolactonase [Spirochaetales bacterium]HRS65002.1 6-phosphogluconolactonase [Spirochaetia bacterium]
MSALYYHEFSSFPHWVQESALFIYNSIKTAYEFQNQPIVCLAGGNTPIPVYRALTNLLSALPADFAVPSVSGTSSVPSGFDTTDEPITTRKPLLIIPGDERITGTSHLQCSNRNESMLREVFHTLLSSRQAELISWYKEYYTSSYYERNSINTETVALSTTQNTSQICIHMNDYITRLKQVRGPLFDCVVLGVGADGHIAGIFDANARTIEEEKSVSALFTAPAEPRQRVSLLPHILRDSSATLVLVQARGKEVVIKSILEGTHYLINKSICQNAVLYCYTGN